MFTGIVEATGVVKKLTKEGENLHITVDCPFVDELKIDQSIAHNGVCLTVVDINSMGYTVTAIKETLVKSNLGLLNEGDLVNLERSMLANMRVDGHFVQGHVDQTAMCKSIKEEGGSWYYKFQYEPLQEDYVTVEKGSISVNGVSLTVVNSRPDSFEVAIIPYTYEHTNFHRFTVGSIVNLEFDILGKYIAKILRQQQVK